MSLAQEKDDKEPRKSKKSSLLKIIFPKVHSYHITHHRNQKHEYTDFQQLVFFKHLSTIISSN